MKVDEIHIISMADMNGGHVDIGCTNSSFVSANFLKKNSEPEFEKLAKAGGVVSFFQVRAIYKMSEATLLEKVESQIDIMKLIAEQL